MSHVRHRLVALLTLAMVLFIGLPHAAAQQEAKQKQPPKGYKSLFNGKDLSGWRGLVKNVHADAQMSKEDLSKAQAAANERMKQHWKVVDGVLVFDGKGKNLCTGRDYADFDIYIDWKIPKHADSGIYVRGQPQVQIWDPANPGQFRHGNQKGSGGLWNNRLPNNGKDPLVKADNPIGEWNTFRIRMIGLKISIWLNGKLIIDNATLENYWQRGQPGPIIGPIELQNHGNTLYFNNIYIRELVKPQEAMKIEAAIASKTRVTPKKKHKVLAFMRAAGFKHSSIPHGARAVETMGRKTGAWETIISDDIAMFTKENLEQFDAVVLCNTTGTWLHPNALDMKKLAKDGEDAKALRARLQANFLSWIEAGGGVAGFHSASDAFYNNWPAFGKAIIGGYFAGHPWHEKVGIKLDEPNHPLLKVFEGKDFEITDEIYQFRDPYSRDNLRVLLSLDVNKTNMKKGGIKRTDGDFAVAWVKEQGKGRIFYSSLGHRNEIYWNPTIMQFYMDGIQYALRDLDADATPSSKVKSAAVPAEKPTDAIDRFVLAKLAESNISADLPARKRPALNLVDGVTRDEVIAFLNKDKGDDASKTSGWRALFDGSDLNAWMFKKDGWKIEEGVMALQPRGGYIWTKDKFENFVLEGEFKMAKGCNSGIFFRTNPKNPVQGGFEVQVMDTAHQKKPGKHSAGSLYDAMAPKVNAVKPAGEWNKFTLTCDGPKIKFVLNGKETFNVNIDDWKEGNKNPDGSKNKFKTPLKDIERNNHIGFQDHGKPVYFRNVRIKVLKK